MAVRNSNAGVVCGIGGGVVDGYNHVDHAVSSILLTNRTIHECGVLSEAPLPSPLNRHISHSLNLLRDDLGEELIVLFHAFEEIVLVVVRNVLLSCACN